MCKSTYKTRGFYPNIISINKKLCGDGSSTKALILRIPIW